MTNHLLVRLSVALAATVASQLLPATPLVANDYYVDAEFGDDAGGDGSAGKPWRTVTHAMAQVAGAGDRVNVGAGLYDALLGEAPRLSVKDGVQVIGAAASTTRLQSLLVFEDTSLGSTIEKLTFTGLEASARSTVCRLTLSSCLVDLEFDWVRFAAAAGGWLEPRISQCRIQGRAPRLIELDASEGSTLAGEVRDSSFYLGMDGTYLIYVSLGAGSHFSTDFIGNLFDAKRHEGMAFWIGYDVIEPRNTFDSFYLNNTLLIGSFHLMYGVEHDLVLVNNILLQENGLWLADPDRIWHNLLTDPDLIGRNGNITGDPRFRDPRTDYRLLPSSPCVDAGLDLASLPLADSRGTPRRLDGDLSARATVDIGAYELTHAELTVGGELRPGGYVDVAVDGPQGLLGFLFLGLEPDFVPLGSLGALLLTPVAGFAPAVLGALPVQARFSVPDAEGLGGLCFFGQALALHPALAAGTAGNRVTIALAE
ncbi:MAG: DUF1565 domain-containing protein [Planctomycetota bacterium]